MTDHTTDMDAVIATAQEAVEALMAGPKPIDPFDMYGIVLPADMRHEIINLEKYLPGPRRTKGTVTLHDGPSLVAYVAKHAEGTHTAVYADLDTSTITAVLNGHAKSEHPEADHTGWGDHRAGYTVRKSPEWKKWEHRNTTWLSQADFAEHIEECSDEIVDPTAGEMLDLAQTLQANNKVAFRSQTMLANGQRQFKYEETVDARAGQQGTMKIPARFKLGVRLYEGADQPFYSVTARLQFRLRDGTLSLRYVLDRPHDMLRAAFDDVVTAVESGTKIAAYRGAAPPALA